MNKKIVIALFITVIFQVIVLIGMVVKAALPMYTGIEIKVATLPVDPRSMFRGNYALLNYDFSRIEIDQLLASEELRNDEKIYVTLKIGRNSIYEYERITLQKPKAGMFIQGRIKNQSYSGGVHSLRLEYGIEAYFAPKDKALAIERTLGAGAVAILMIDKDGHARLKSVQKKEI